MRDRKQFFRSWTVVLACAGTTSVHAQFLAAPGFTAHSSVLSTGSSFIGGLCRLPTANLALFDGSRIREIDPVTGAEIATLYQSPSFQFGSFLVLAPDASALFLGESSFGTIKRIPLDGSSPSVVAIVPLNYDATFDATGQLFVTRGNATWTGTEIVRVDPGIGTIDVIATVPGPSGPLVFLADGRLVYGENSPLYPAPPGSGALYSWSASQVASALGTSFLTLADAEVFASGLDVISDVVVDAEGDLLIADSVYGRIVEVDPFSGARTTFGEVPAGSASGVTYLEFLDDGAADPATFAPFQPASGGRLAAVVSDFVSLTSLVISSPKRPRLEVQPAGDVAPGPFTLTLTDAPPHGLGFCFVALAPQPETSSWVYGTPFFFGLAPATTFLIGSLPLSANGDLVLPAQNPALGLTVYVQIAVIESDGTPRGTSDVLALTLLRGP